MSPRTKNFKVGSIIYFEKDKAESVYLLKEGKINLIYDDLQLGDKVIDSISAGEFFGVKSGLIRYPREETAKVVQDSLVLEFSATEFESLITKNTNIVLKMLKAFSNQLRKVGKQVQSIVATKVTTETSDNFFLIGEYYLKNKKYKQAITVYQRYTHYYPDGKYASLAEKRLELTKKALDTYGEGGGPAPILDNVIQQNVKQNKPVKTEEDDHPDQSFNKSLDGDQNSQGKNYYKGLSFMSQGKYIDAFNVFKKVLQEGTEEEKNMSNLEIGKCLFFLKKYNECINHLHGFITKNPNFHDKNEVFFYIASSYASINDKSNASDYFNDIISNSNENDKIYRKAQKALKELG